MKKQFLLLFVALLMATLSSWAATITVGPSGMYSTIEAAVASANDGDVIQIADGTYFLTAPLYLNHKLTINGASESGVIINATGTPSTSWGINPNKSNTTLSNFTMVPNGTNGGYPIHVGDNMVPEVISNVTLSHITINGAKKTAFDFNGVDNLTLSYLTATNTTGGNGIQVSGCTIVKASYITTSGNAWGGFAIYCSKPVPNGVGRGSSNVTIDGTTSTFGEGTKIYSQDEFGYFNTNTTVTGFDYSVQNPIGAAGYTIYTIDKTSALAKASSLSSPQSSIVKQISTGQFVVAPGLSIQAAINAAAPGNQINVGAGTYAESLSINKSLSLIGAGKTQTIIQPSALLTTGVGHKYDPNMKVALFINGASAVTVKDMTIDGNNLGENAVVFWNASSGKLENLKILNPQTFDGMQTGQGLAVDATALAAVNLDVVNCDFLQWNKNAIDAVNGNGGASNGGTLVINVTGGTIVGRGSQSTIAQNGILFWPRAGADVYGNITGVAFSNMQYSTEPMNCGVLLYGILPSSVTNCTFSNVDLFIDNEGTANTSATCNWYGGVAPTTAKIIGPVTYIPYSLSNGGPCTGGLTPAPITSIGAPISTACGSFDVQITVQDFRSVGAISLALNYDPAVLVYQSVTLDPAITSPSTSANSGQFRLSSFPSVPITLADNAVLFTLHFNLQPDASGKTTNLNWSTVSSEREYSGPDGDPVYASTFTNKVLTIPSKLYASATAPAIKCFEGGTTIVKVFATGGVAPYTGVGNFTVSAGTHEYKVTDANGCTATASITVAQPAELVVSGTVTNMTCKDTPNGAIDLTVSGGAASSGPLSVDGIIGTEWDGASVVRVNYNPSAPTSNFGSPTNENHQVAYDIYTRQDSKFMYVGLKTVSSAGGTPALPFANLYFGNANPGVGSFVGFEVTNDRAFIPGVSGYFPLASLVGTPNQVFYSVNTSGEYVIEFALPFSFIQNDPLPMGFPKMIGGSPNDFFELRMSQTFGYSVAGGQAAYGNNRLGGFGVAQPSTCANTGYTYLWSNGATTQDLTGVAAGNYSVVVTDANCCTKSATFTINAADVTPPVLTVPSAVSVYQQDAKDPYATGVATATDCSGPVTITYDDNRAGLNLCNATGIIVRTWTAKDFYGNTSTGTQTITVQDNIDPVVVAPANITANTDAGQCSAVVNYPAPTATDFGFFQGFENPAWVAGLALNSPSVDWNEYKSQIVRVASGIDGIISKTGSAHAVINTTTTIAANETGAFSRVGGYNGTFGAGFISSVDVYFNMSDPTIAAGTYGWDLDQAVSDNAGGFKRDFIYHVGGDNTGIYVAVDNNSNNGIPGMSVSYIKSQTHASISSSGWYTMKWETRDNAGFLAVDFTILDASGTPVWTNTINTTDAIATVGGNRYMWFNFVSANKLAIDNTSLTRKLAVTADKASGTVFAKGTTVVALTASDACGKTATSSFTVTVVDNQAPVITTCAPAQLAVVTTECGVAMPDFTHSITATDNCGVTSVTQIPAIGTIMPYQAEPYVVTIKATDDAGLFASCTSSFTVQKASISGILKYHKPTGIDDVSNADVALNNVDVSLYRSNNRTSIATVTTGSDGSYSFGNLCAGEYAIQITRNDKGVGGINATDAARVNKWSVSGGSIEYVKFLAGDVDGNLFINNNDPQMIQAYFVNNNIKPNPAPFSRRPWSYWKKGVKISSTENTKPGYFNVTVSGANVTDFNLYGMVTGDFNGSFIPDPTKAATWSLELNNNSMVNAGSSQEIELPLRAASAMQVGAVSMILNIPSGLVTVQDVKVNGSTDPVTWAVNGNELRIGWYSSTPVDVAENGKLIALKLKTTSAFTTGQTMDIALKFDPLNELADGNYDVIEGANLLVAQVANSVTSVLNPSDSKSLSLRNYPNPFKGLTTVDYKLPIQGKVNITVYNQLGQQVQTLIDATQNAGEYSIRMDGTNLMPGIYIAKLRLSNSGVDMIGTLKLSIMK